MDFKKILRALLISAFKLSDGEVDSLLQESETNTADTTLAAILAKDKDRVAELMKPREGQTFQDGYKKAKKEVLAGLEKELKEKYNLSTESTGLELIEEAITAQTGSKTKLSEEEVKKHPIYQTLEKDLRKQLKEKDTEMETKVKELETGFQKNQTFADVSKDGLQILEGLQPVLPKSATVAATIKNKFLEESKSFDYEKQDGKWIVTKDGQVQKNAHGHTLYLEDLVKDKAGNYFEFQQNNGGGNAGNGGADDQKRNNGGQAVDPKYPAGITKPATVEDLYKIVNDTAIKPEDRQVVLRTWESEQKQAAQ